MQKNSSPHQSISTRSLWLWLLAFAIVASSLFEKAQAETRNGSSETKVEPLVHLQAASGLAIDFQTQNGKTIQDKVPEVRDIPHLVLFRNGELAGAEQRTLRLYLTGLEVPPANGLTLTLKVETQHGDPDQGGDEKGRILVWEHSQCIAQKMDGLPSSLSLEKEIGGTIDLQGEPVRTPSDYFRIELVAHEGSSTDGEPIFEYVEEYAFLMESQWVAPLEGLVEVAPRAAPDELVLYYGDMFPFQANPDDPQSRLPRKAVHAYIQEQLGPALIAVVQKQTNEWGFHWHEEWTGFRGGADRDRLSVALMPGGLWFHGKAPNHAHGGISINLDNENRGAYGSLTDWIVSVFSHELFHNLQRDLSLTHGRGGDVDGKQEAWEFLAEGTAVVATAAGNPEVEFSDSSKNRVYASRANRFLDGTKSFESGLKTSYMEIDPYSTSIYWRFLYEQCSGPAGTQGDLEVGMQVIRQTLTTLYAVDDLAEISPEGRVEALPALMDKVFSKAAWCPFRTYEESLVAFSQAVYTLRLAGGRCERGAGLAGCGFYDPNGLYAEPQVDEIAFAGRETSYRSGIGSSFGMAFVEVVFGPESQGGSLELAFEPAEGGAAEFSVQVWKLARGEGGRLERIPDKANAPDVLVRAGEGGGGAYLVERIDRDSYERLGLVITRLDSREKQDPLGDFTISLRPAVSPPVQLKGD